MTERTPPIPVCIDTREPCEAMMRAFAAFEEFEVHQQYLEIGDYLIDDALLVERKTLSDLAQSIVEGRLFSQALKLVEGQRPALLILEGTLSDLRYSQIKWEVVQGALVTVTLFIGLPILRSRTPEESVRAMLFAARQRRVATFSTLTRRTRRPKGKAALQSHILRGLPGIGPERAKALIEHFGSVAAVIAADDEALAKVDDLGAASIRKMRNAVADS